MRKGKLQQSVLVRSVFKMLGQKREDAAGPAVGRGVSALAGEKETQVFSCAPVLVKDPEDAVLAVCRVCNSVAAAPARGRGYRQQLPAGVADAAGGDGRKEFKGADAGG